MRLDNKMLFTNKEHDMYIFYESLSDEQRQIVDEKLSDIIPELRREGVSEGDIYDLRCTVARDTFKLLRG